MTPEFQHSMHLLTFEQEEDCGAHMEPGMETDILWAPCKQLPWFRMVFTRPSGHRRWLPLRGEVLGEDEVWKLRNEDLFDVLEMML